MRMQRNFTIGLITLLLSMVCPAARDALALEESASEPTMLAMADIDAEDRLAMLDLLSVLEEETEIATKTKMNSDYVPGMVTVLHGEQLEALGIRTVAEALSLVPGVQVARISSGEPTVKVRGFTYPFNAGNIKVMLNSIALSRESSGLNSTVLLMPVAQVDRVEIIRGPGSSIYGNFAMAGVVNIITRSSGGRVFAQGGDDESLTGGGHYTYQNQEQSLNVGLNVSLADDGESAAIINSDPDEARSVGVFHLDYKDFSFKIEGVKRDIDYQTTTLPPSQTGSQLPTNNPADPLPQPRRASAEEKSWAAEARQNVKLGGAALDFYLSYLSNEGDLKDPDRGFSGNRVEAGCDLDWTPFTGHQLLLGLSYTDSRIDNAHEQGRPDDPLNREFRIADISRRNYAASIQDQIDLFDNFALTLGVRYDNYDDVGDLLTPKIAAVYRLGENHVLKAQYSEGFRSPSFWELYREGTAAENLDFEVMGTTELIYIYRQPGAVGRVTLYHSKIKDGIYAELGSGFENSVTIESRGAEIEWDQKVTDTLRLLANVSYVKSEDERWVAQGSDDSPGVADWLANVAFLFEPLPKLMITGRWLHVGNQYRTNGDVQGYDPIDLTVSRSDLFVNGLTLRGGIKNIFDDTIIYTTQRPHGLSEDEFTGRIFWLQVAYNF